MRRCFAPFFGLPLATFCARHCTLSVTCGDTVALTRSDYGSFSDEMRRDPFPVYQRMRSESPLYFEPQTGLWMLFDCESVRWALTDHETFSSRHGVDWIVFTDPPRHTKLRALISKAFTPRSVANLERRIGELSRGLLDELNGRDEIDLVAEYSTRPIAMSGSLQMQSDLTWGAKGVAAGER